MKTIREYFFLTAIVLLCDFTFVNAQRIEAGIIAGASNYLGEIGGDAENGKAFILDLQYRYTRPAMGAFGRYEISPFIAANLTFIYGRIGGNDQLSSNYGRHLRNASFMSDIYEISTQMDITLFRKEIAFQKNPFALPYSKIIGGYGFVGVGFFHFNPKAKYNGKWYKLQPMGTEGQLIYSGRKKYALTQISIPLGAGIYCFINKQVRIGLELGYRKTFTDYLDDVSTTFADPALISEKQGVLAALLANRSGEVTSSPEDLQFTLPGQKRGNPFNKDAYIFTVIKVSYVLNKEEAQNGLVY